MGRRPITAEERRAQLLERGATEFARRGHRGVGITDIARASGIAVPTIYHRFADKEEFFLQATKAAVTALVHQVREACPRELTAPEALLLEEAASSHRLALLARVLQEARDPSIRPVALEAMALLEEALSSLGEAAPMGRAPVLAAALLATAGLYGENE